MARGKVRKAARLAQSAQTHARLAALFEEIRLSCEGAFDACGNNAIFCASKRNNIAFCRRNAQRIRSAPGQKTRGQLADDLPRSRLTSEKKHTKKASQSGSEMKEGAREHCAVQKTMSQYPDKGSRQAAVEGLMQ